MPTAANGTPLGDRRRLRACFKVLLGAREPVGPPELVFGPSPTPSYNDQRAVSNLCLSRRPLLHQWRAFGFGVSGPWRFSPAPTFYNSGVSPFTTTTIWLLLETSPWTTHCPVPTLSSWTRAPRPGQPRPSINHFKFTPLRRCLAETAYAHD